MLALISRSIKRFAFGNAWTVKRSGPHFLPVDGVCQGPDLSCQRKVGMSLICAK
jgi:hypothetical protein